MARCWTCGTYSPDLRYSCATCARLDAIREIRDAAHAASIESAEKLEAIADLHRETHEALLTGFNRLNQTLEWGFGSLLWTIDQQTEVLRSIDATLKTPGQTQAKEWRIIGEQLRQRGDPGSAAQFFLDALKLNPLDYRIYLGLAHAYFELSRFEDADQVLVASLPHAPRTGFDYRSVTYRLLGRIRFCNEEYGGAVEQLRRAVAIEPKYAKAFYDLAQYASCTASERDCVTSLKDAIALEPNYWYAACAEPLLDPFRSQVDATLHSLLAAPLAQAEEDLQEAMTLMTAAQPKADECKRLAGALHKPDSSRTFMSQASKALESARAPFNRSDYKNALAAARRAAFARDQALTALNQVEQELQNLRTAEEEQRAALEAAEKERQITDAKRRQTRQRVLIGIAVYLMISGTVGFIFDEQTIEGFAQGIYIGILIPIGIFFLLALLNS